MKLIYLKSAIKCDSSNIAISIKISFLRVLVTIEPGRSLPQFVTTNCLIKGQRNLFLALDKWLCLSSTQKLSLLWISKKHMTILR